MNFYYTVSQDLRHLISPILDSKSLGLTYPRFDRPQKSGVEVLRVKMVDERYTGTHSMNWRVGSNSSN